jgi:glycosyltransferase EpsF
MGSSTIKKIKVLHVVGGMNRAGAETFVMNLLRKIDKENFDFEFLYFTKKDCHYDDEITKLGGRIHRIDLNNSVFQIFKLIDFFSTNNFNVIHSHVLFKNYIFILAAFVAKIKIRIAHSHNTSDRSSNKLIGKLYHGFAKIILHFFANYKVACGTKAAKFLFPFSKNVFIVNNGIDLNISQEKFNSDIFSEYLDSGKEIILLQVGRLEKVKNIEFSIRFVKFLKERRYEIKFFILGQGSLENDLRVQVENLELQKDVHFLGVRSNVIEYMKNADVLLMPSLHEGFPVVLIEAQSIGLNCILSDLIPKEVDLELGLLKFVSLEKMQLWEEKLSSLNSKEVIGIDKCSIKLKKLGFDIEHNVNILKNIYYA